MVRPDLPPVGGYVLAGGQSSRMGRDKALLRLADKSLAEHAVIKLRRLCAEVNILGSDPELDAIAPSVCDLHPGCGPVAGLEAALLHSQYDWNLILAVDMPFLPTFYLDDWLWATLSKRSRLGRWLSFWRSEPVDERRISMISIDAKPQPAVLIVHREIAPYLSRSLARGELKLLSALEAAAHQIAEKKKTKLNRVFLEMQYDDFYPPDLKNNNDAWRTPTKEQREGIPDGWFANLNTPEEFAEAERNLGALDT